MPAYGSGNHFGRNEGATCPQQSSPPLATCRYLLDKIAGCVHNACVRKTFAMSVDGREPARVIEAIKYELKKYLKRERNKPLPGGADFWDFACRVGPGDAEAKPVHVGDLNRAVDDGVTQQWQQIYVEILAKPTRRRRGTDGGSSGSAES